MSRENYLLMQPLISNVLDFSLINWLDTSQVAFPTLYATLARGDNVYRGKDISMQIIRDQQQDLADCLVDIVRVGFVDSLTIGCVASRVVLYVSLIFIIGVVAIKFGLAVLFGWFVSWRLGNFKGESLEQRRTRAAEIERWTDDIYRPAPARYRPNVRKSMLPTKSRFSTAALKPAPTGNRQSMYGNQYPRSITTTTFSGKTLGVGMKNSPPGSPGGYGSSNSLPTSPSSASVSLIEIQCVVNC